MVRLGSNSGWTGRGCVLCRLDLRSDMLLSHGDLSRMVGKRSHFPGTWDVSSGLEAAPLLPGLASLPGSLGLGAPSSPAVPATLSEPITHTPCHAPFTAAPGLLCTLGLGRGGLHPLTSHTWGFGNMTLSCKATRILTPEFGHGVGLRGSTKFCLQPSPPHCCSCKKSSAREMGVTPAKA